MTKEQVFLALGPPTEVVGGGRYTLTSHMTREEILGYDEWVFWFSKGVRTPVAFDRSTQEVSGFHIPWG